VGESHPRRGSGHDSIHLHSKEPATKELAQLRENIEFPQRGGIAEEDHYRAKAALEEILAEQAARELSKERA